MTEIHKALAVGYECLAAWSDILDRINVFPVADNDTGTNLRLSLVPLREPAYGETQIISQLSRCATGNSGNIAAAFFREFVQADTLAELPVQVKFGRDKAWHAVAKPRRGTMLSVFEALANRLDDSRWSLDSYPLVRDGLRETVLAGDQHLPELQKAGVVDAGALGMFILLDGFFQQLAGVRKISVPVLDLFQGRLSINRDFEFTSSNSYCIEAVIETADGSPIALDQLSELGDSVVMVRDAERLKIHMHSPEPALLRRRLADIAEVLDWSDEPIDESGSAALPLVDNERVINIVSDAAGSLPRELARRYGISLLDSYIVAGGRSRPESLWSPESLYPKMRIGEKVTTAQASTFERHQNYERICREGGRTLYLCVGSAFTGNFETVIAWKKDHDRGDSLEVLDTGAASGRLGLIALLTARFAESATNRQTVVAYARRKITDCREYVFIDELKYLVAGGRVSRAGGFLGDLLHLKPVISPISTGVRKEGVVRNRRGQLAFALKKLSEFFDSSDRPVIMLQYSDNEKWVQGMVKQEVSDLLPQAEIVMVPLSLTSGVHMGPGTWALAFDLA